MNMLRPISRTYDRAEHAYPKELDLLAAMIDGAGGVRRELGAPAPPASSATSGRATDRREGRQERHQPRLGDVHRRDVLGRRRPAALAAAPGARQLRDRLGRRAPSSRSASAGIWASMAITEPDIGSDTAKIRTTAVLDGDEYVLNGEKIYVTSGERSDAVVVWATLDALAGPRGDQVVRRAQGHAGHDRRAARAQARHQGLRHRRDQLRRLPGAGGEPARLGRHRHQARASRARWRPSTTPARWWPRWPSAARRRRST